MCQRCKDMQAYWRERIQEARQMFPQENESHIKELLETDPTLDEAAIRGLFASRGADYSLAVACAKVAIEFLHSNSGYDATCTLGLVGSFVARLAVHQQEILTMRSGSDGGTPTTPGKPPGAPNGEKLH